MIPGRLVGGMLACSLLTGCGGRRATQGTATPLVGDVVEATSADGPAPPFDLNGTWVHGSGGEPGPEVRVITTQAQCLYHPAVWIIQQDGKSIEAFQFPESWDQGVALREPRSLPPRVSGRISGLNVRMDDQVSHYRLRYDSASTHLRGTLNGVSFWAVRENVVHPAGCIPPP
jgi:hypothetical protein